MGSPDGEVGAGRVGAPGSISGGTSTAALHVDGRVGHPLARCAALATGTPVEIAPSEWSAVFDRIWKERCGPLAWLRSRSTIERDAPAEVADRWAKMVEDSSTSSFQQLDVIDQVSKWTSAHGVRVIVMKGLPLAQQLYGEAWARPANDVDLYVAAAEREAVADILGATGWRLVHGSAPNDEQFAQVVGRSVRLIEIHSSLAGTWMSHLPFPEPESVPVAIDGLVVNAHGGPFLPAYLASHLLHHGDRPLLWLLDFATLWNSLGEHQRSEARAAARRARLTRVLRAAASWGAMLPQMADAPSAKCVQHFESVVLAHRENIVVRQLIQHSAHPLDAAKVLAHLIWPRELRAHRGGFTRLWKHRLMRRFQHAGNGVRAYRPR